MDKLKKKASIKAKTPEAFLYEKEKKERKVTDKDLFVLPLKKQQKKNKK